MAKENFRVKTYADGFEHDDATLRCVEIVRIKENYASKPGIWDAKYALDMRRINFDFGKEINFPPRRKRNRVKPVKEKYGAEKERT